ncbi:transposase [Streptomyces sp. NPDC005728]|uniref:transposase n=1 Tax=Streptomyces sp. NPDC005728 TaxID=3157054 RepID=UPI00340C638F
MGDPATPGAGGEAWWTTGRAHSAEIVNALAYRLRVGCAWRLLPHDLPPWRTTYHYWRLWRREGLRERVLTVLRERERLRLSRVRVGHPGQGRHNPGHRRLNFRKPRHLELFAGRER